MRNPWDRMVSVYHHQRQTVPQNHAKATWLDFRGHVLRVESLDDDFAALCAARGLTGI